MVNGSAANHYQKGGKMRYGKVKLFITLGVCLAVGLAVMPAGPAEAKITIKAISAWPVNEVSVADDYLVWNVTKDSIKVREVVVNPNAWPAAGVFDIPPMDPKDAAGIAPSDWMQAQSLDVTDVDQAIYDRINEAYGTDVKMRMKMFFDEMKNEGE